MTADEFAQQYAARSGVTVEWLREHAERARSRVLLLNQGCDDLALQDAAMEFLEQALGPLPGDLAPT